MKVVPMIVLFEGVHWMILRICERLIRGSCPITQKSGGEPPFKLSLIENDTELWCALWTGVPKYNRERTH